VHVWLVRVDTLRQVVRDGETWFCVEADATFRVWVRFEVDVDAQAEEEKEKGRGFEARMTLDVGSAGRVQSWRAVRSSREELFEGVLDMTGSTVRPFRFGKRSVSSARPSSGADGLDVDAESATRVRLVSTLLEVTPGEDKAVEEDVDLAREEDEELQALSEWPRPEAPPAQARLTAPDDDGGDSAESAFSVVADGQKFWSLPGAALGLGERLYWWRGSYQPWSREIALDRHADAVAKYEQELHVFHAKKKELADLLKRRRNNPARGPRLAKRLVWQQATLTTRREVAEKRVAVRCDTPERMQLRRWIEPEEQAPMIEAKEGRRKPVKREGGPHGPRRSKRSRHAAASEEMDACNMCDLTAADAAPRWSVRAAEGVARDEVSVDD